MTDVISCGVFVFMKGYCNCSRVKLSVLIGGQWLPWSSIVQALGAYAEPWQVRTASHFSAFSQNQETHTSNRKMLLYKVTWSQKWNAKSMFQVKETFYLAEFLQVNSIQFYLYTALYNWDCHKAALRKHINFQSKF